MPSTQRRSGARPASRPQPPRPSGAQAAALRSRLFEVVEPVAGRAGYDLEDLSVQRMGRRSVVRITVDRDGGVPLDAIADLARAVSAAIDDAEAAHGEIVVGEYQLEVSSPGVDRPLTAPRHWRRNLHRLVKVKTKAAEGVPARTITGRVVAAAEDGVTLDVDGTEREYRYADLGAGRVEIEFSRIDEIADDELVEFTEEDDDADGDDRDGEDAR
jgi:ribosome maturation factor RimP